MTLIFATNNQHKVEEVKKIIGGDLHIITLKDAGIDIDIPEPHDTLEANATEKSTVIHRMTNQNCFSEDTGLEVSALNGAPGVHSARYAGEERDPQKNIDRLLFELKDENKRNARFRTVISLIWQNEEHLFEGICDGHIIKTQAGEKGFGYDPVFIPNGSDKTFAQMSLEEKALYSHRAKAMAKLTAFLSQIGKISS
jgi:XTP/dITP diphosphohydrolase